MENQTPSDLNFNLNRALLAWKAELAGEPGVSAENVRELEVHLLESIAALKRRGMNDQEAFLKARQQMGSMNKVGAEFAKDNPLRIWRDRVFWVALAGFILSLISSALEVPTTRLAHRASESLGEWAAAATFSVLNLIPILGGFLLLATGRIQIIYSRVSWLFVSRWRLGIVGFLLTIVAHIQGARGLIVYELGFLGFALVMMPREMLAAARVKIEGAADWRNSIKLWRDRLFWIAATQLAIGAWTMVVSAGITTYLHNNPPESTRPVSLLLAVIVFFLAWLIPMAVVGVALSRAWLSSATRVLESRSGVLIIGLVIVLVSSCLCLWIYHCGVHSKSMSLAESRDSVLYSGVAWFILQAGLIWTMLWHLRPQQRMLVVEAT